MQFVKSFKELDKNSVTIAGGKGASLGEMINAGIPVPDGFVVLASTFDHFIEETDINVEIDAELSKVNKNDVNSIDNASRVVQSLILTKAIPATISEEILAAYQKLKAKTENSKQDNFLVAVRSSATAEDSSTASWAGELDSFLNTTEEKLLENVKKCWASLFTPRAIFYRIEKGLSSTKVSVAVVVQKMVDSEVSGITFTVHPVTQDKTQMIIEAGWGLGEAIVGGLITPDAYVINKETKEIVDINISEQTKQIVRDGEAGTKESEVSESDREKQKLSKEQILEIADICIKIEDHYGFPCDIEWALDSARAAASGGGEFFIVQSRPITTL